jgi:flagellar basal body-associated protein FliL
VTPVKQERRSHVRKWRNYRREEPPSNGDGKSGVDDGSMTRDDMKERDMISVLLLELLLAVLGAGLVYSLWRQESSRPLVRVMAGALFASSVLQLLGYFLARSGPWQASEITWGMAVILKLALLVAAALLGRAQAKAGNSVAMVLIILIVLLTLLTGWGAIVMMYMNLVWSHGG